MAQSGAAVPETAPVGTVLQAKEALKPAEVQVAQAGRGLRAEALNRRKNAAFRRQGEWFFLPVPGFVADVSLILRNEPLRRGNGGKPHLVEFCYRDRLKSLHVLGSAGSEVYRTRRDFYRVSFFHCGYSKMKWIGWRRRHDWRTKKG